MRNDILGKRGFELAINTLVVIILGIVILGGGFAIIKNITDIGSEVLEGVDASTQKQIDTLLARGELLALPTNEVSGPYDSYLFVLGYSNRLPLAYAFEPNITPISVIQKEGTVITYADDPNQFPPAFIENFNQGVVLNPNEQARSVPFSITFEKGMPQGTYTYKVRVFYNDTIDRNTTYAEKLLRISIT